jgi:hypothetical protein
MCAAIIMPSANAEAMSEHLKEISAQVALGAHAVMVCDGAGWHQSGGRLRVPANLTLLPLPPYAPDLKRVKVSEKETSAAIFSPTMATEFVERAAPRVLQQMRQGSRTCRHGNDRKRLIRRTAVVRTRMPGDVGGAASRDVPPIPMRQGSGPRNAWLAWDGDAGLLMRRHPKPCAPHRCRGCVPIARHRRQEAFAIWRAR